MFIDRTIEPVLALPRQLKRTLVLGLDVGLCVFTVWFAFYLRLGEFVRLEGSGWPAAVASPIIALPIFIRWGLYRAIFRHVSWEALGAIVSACLLYGVIYVSIFTVIGVSGVPRTVGLLQPLLLLLAVGGSRVFGRFWLGGRYRELLRRSARKKVFIYGAGTGGRQLASAIGESGEMEAVGFFDDDVKLQGSVLGGKIVFAPERMEELVDKHDVSEILLALPRTARRRRTEILSRIRSLSVAVRTLPGLMEVARGSVTVTDLRPLDIDDLLGRDAVVPDVSLLECNIKGKTVMVTGAGGSIGGELCRQIVQIGPETLLLVESNEYALYQVFHELERLCENGGLAEVRILPLLASVTDVQRMRSIICARRPDTLYHAAAYKHVPLVEHNVVEGVRNNLFGTWVCASLAAEAGVDRFVLISTDKAVRPTNVMGASKRLAELGLQALADSSSSTVFSIVRFGNVLGSSGSVVPLFRKQIAEGGPVTVTHAEITRYFMTIPEAAQLVIQAAAMATGGEVFVLDMGEPLKVVDLARRMIELSGLKIQSQEEPDGDIAISFSGLRPGEKLYEELLIGDNPVATAHPRIMMANEAFLPLKDFEFGIARMSQALSAQDAFLVRQLLAELVSDYQPAANFVDHIYSSWDDKMGRQLANLSEEWRTDQLSTRLQGFEAGI